MNYINVGKLRSFLENVPSNSYVAVGTRENNEIEEIRQESGIVDMSIKSVGFDSSNSNEVYIKLYTNKYDGSGCLRFTR